MLRSILRFTCVGLLAGSAPLALAQMEMPPVNASGMLLAQNDAAIEQSRLYREATPPNTIGIDANGHALPVAATSSTGEDDSFGAQAILKNEEKPQPFFVTASGSFNYTDNVALTSRGERDDFIGVVDAGIGWSKRLTDELATDWFGHISLFRYNETTSLDFTDFAFGAGLTYTPRALGGIALFARYDFTELIDRSSDQILMEHAVTVGAQKVFALGRSHAFALGVSGTGALSDPKNAQREVLGAVASYHLDLTRSLSTDLLYRPAAHFYTHAGHTDFNQIISLDLHYRFSQAAELRASFNYALNRSDRAAFDYNAITTGGTIAFSVHF